MSKWMTKRPKKKQREMGAVGREAVHSIQYYLSLQPPHPYPLQVGLGPASGSLPERAYQSRM
jgi:hypothetical protein